MLNKAKIHHNKQTIAGFTKVKKSAKALLETKP